MGSRELRGSLFTWFGIVGGALTIVNNWSNFRELSYWARLIVENFSKLSFAFWSFLASTINLDISIEAANFLSATAFYGSVVAGAIISGGFRPFLVETKRNKLKIILGIGLVFFGLSFPILGLLIFPFIFYIISEGNAVSRVLLASTYTAFLLFIFLGFPGAGTFLRYQAEIADVSLVLFPVVVFAPLLLAHTNALQKRLTFLLVGATAMVSFSEISKLIRYIGDKLVT